jgi:hypothetical protein
VNVLLLLILLASVITNLHAQGLPLSFPRHHPDTLKAWTTVVMSELANKHPGFYRYTSKHSFDRAIDSTVRSMNDSLTTLEYYRRLKPLFARIGCVHTSIRLSQEAMNALDKEPSMFPLDVFVDSAKHVFISGNRSRNTDIPLKGEILSINGKPIAEILSALWDAIPSDGYNRSLKFLILNHRFAFWYQTLIDNPRTFDIEVAFGGTQTSFKVDGVTAQKFPSMKELESANSRQLTFSIKDGVGHLTIHSFANSSVKSHDQKFKKFIKQTVKTVNSKKIKNLVIDVRYNTGGTDGNAAFLAANFFDTPFRYWDRIEVTEAIAREVRGLKRIFYGKPLKREGFYQWKKAWWTKEFNYFEKQHPVKNPYRGNVYILTNGLCLSSCADVVAILSANGKAIVIGQETGGGFQGNTSGLMPSADVPGGLRMTVPLLKYVNAVDKQSNYGRGTIPSYIITPSLDEWINHKDVEMEFVLKLIDSGKSLPSK